MTSLRLATLALALGLGGCFPFCADCGECGFVGGPAPEDELASYQPGLTADGVPAVAVRAWAEGTCVESDLVWVIFEPTGVVVRRPALGEALDMSETAVSGTTFADGRELSATWVELRQQLELDLEGDAVDCAPGEGATVDCVPR